MALDNVISLENAVIGVNDHIVLQHVNLSVGKGEFVYIIGRVGSGKTSLIKTINAELPLIEGTGMVAGYNLEDLKRKEVPMLRRKLGIVFQDFQLLIDRSVDSNLEFALKATGWNGSPRSLRKLTWVIKVIRCPTSFQAVNSNVSLLRGHF